MKTQEIKFKELNHNYSILIGNNTLNLLPKKLKYFVQNKKNSINSRLKIPNKFKK